MDGLSYAAGLIEGEGCFSASLKKRQLSLRVLMGDVEPLLKLNSIIGGSGSICGPYCANKYNRRPMWNYQLNRREEVLMWAEKLFPLMSPRRQKQIIAMLKLDMSNPLRIASNLDTRRPTTYIEQREYRRIRQLANI